MATNKSPFVGSLFGHTVPLVIKGQFQAGATQAIKRGELLEFNGTNWVPLASDKGMSATVGIAAEEIKDGDRAGYYGVIVPRPGDIFRFALSAASAIAVGASVYWASSQSVASSGTNILGDVADQDHYPQFQGHLADDASPDSGTTIGSTSEVGITIRSAASYYSAIQG